MVDNGPASLIRYGLFLFCSLISCVHLEHSPFKTLKGRRKNMDGGLELLMSFSSTETNTYAVLNLPC